MNFEAYRAAWASRALGVKGAELLVALAIAAHVNRQGLAWPSVDTIAELAGVNHRHAKKLIASLRDRGVLLVVKGGGGRGKSNSYRLRPLTPEEISKALAVPETVANAASLPPETVANAASLAPETVSESALFKRKRVLFATLNGVLGNPRTIEGTIRAGAREEAEPSHGSDIERAACRLAKAAERRGEQCLVVAGWRDAGITRCAIERFGADPETLHRAGCDVPRDLRRAAHG